MNRFYSTRLTNFVLVSVCTFVAGCGLEADKDGGTEFKQVFIIATEQLTPPAVGYAQIYKPDFKCAVDPANPAAGQAVGFFLTVIAAWPQELKMRLIDSQAQAQTSLTMLPPPTSEEKALAANPQPFNQSVSDRLAEGLSVYWLADEHPPADGWEHRLAVIIPCTSLSPFNRLKVFISTTSDNMPIGGDDIELVEDFFYMAVIGDSIQWGSGLNQQDKIFSLVSEAIEKNTNRRVIRQILAVPGATIVPTEDDGSCQANCFGEVPPAITSITLQVELIEHPELMDLILMDGCINDVSLDTILDPEIDQEKLVESTHNFCAQEMTTLLQKVRSLAPQAYVVVTGYYQMISQESDFLGVNQWADSTSTQTDEELTASINMLAANSAVFRDHSSTSLAAAVEAVNGLQAAPAMSAFAEPQFAPANAVFAPDSWLWNLTKGNQLIVGQEADLTLIPEDPLLEFRLSACLEANSFADYVGCVYSSVGHPNPQGARAYADAVIQSLADLGVLPSDNNAQ